MSSDKKHPVALVVGALLALGLTIGAGGPIGVTAHAHARCPGPLPSIPSQAPSPIPEPSPQPSPPVFDAGPPIDAAPYDSGIPFDAGR